MGKISSVGEGSREQAQKKARDHPKRAGEGRKIWQQRTDLKGKAGGS